MAVFDVGRGCSADRVEIVQCRAVLSHGNGAYEQLSGRNLTGSSTFFIRTGRDVYYLDFEKHCAREHRRGGSHHQHSSALSSAYGDVILLSSARTRRISLRYLMKCSLRSYCEASRGFKSCSDSVTSTLQRCLHLTLVRQTFCVQLALEDISRVFCAGRGCSHWNPLSVRPLRAHTGRNFRNGIVHAHAHAHAHGQSISTGRALDHLRDWMLLLRQYETLLYHLELYCGSLSLERSVEEVEFVEALRLIWFPLQFDADDDDNLIAAEQLQQLMDISFLDANSLIQRLAHNNSNSEVGDARCRPASDVLRDLRASLVATIRQILFCLRQPNGCDISEVDDICDMVYEQLLLPMVAAHRTLPTHPSPLISFCVEALIEFQLVRSKADADVRRSDAEFIVDLVQVHFLFGVRTAQSWEDRDECAALLLNSADRIFHIISRLISSNYPLWVRILFSSSADSIIPKVSN